MDIALWSIAQRGLSLFLLGHLVRYNVTSIWHADDIPSEYVTSPGTLKLPLVLIPRTLLLNSVLSPDPHLLAHQSLPAPAPSPLFPMVHRSNFRSQWVQAIFLQFVAHSNDPTGARTATCLFCALRCCVLMFNLLAARDDCTAPRIMDAMIQLIAQAQLETLLNYRSTLHHKPAAGRHLTLSWDPARGTLFGELFPVSRRRRYLRDPTPSDAAGQSAQACSLLPLANYMRCLSSRTFATTLIWPSASFP